MIPIPGYLYSFRATPGWASCLRPHLCDLDFGAMIPTEHLDAMDVLYVQCITGGQLSIFLIVCIHFKPAQSECLEEYGPMGQKMGRSLCFHERQYSS